MVWVVLIFLVQPWSLNSTELVSMHEQLKADDGSTLLHYLEQGQERFGENNVPALSLSNISVQRMQGMGKQELTVSMWAVWACMS